MNEFKIEYEIFSSPVLVTFSYFLATFLVVLGLVGLRYSYMSSTMVSDCNQPIMIETQTMGTSPIWISTNVPNFADQDLLPGNFPVKRLIINEANKFRSGQSNTSTSLLIPWTHNK